MSGLRKQSPAVPGPEAATAHEFLRDALSRAQATLNEHAAAVAASAGADPVHDFRVNARRTRAALQLCRPLLPKTSRTLGRRLRDVARKLAPARDLDVTLERLAAWRVKIPAELAPGLEPVIARVAQKRGAMAARIRAAVQSAAARKVIADLAREPALKRDGTLARLAPALLRRILGRFRKARKRAVAHDTIEHVHKLRLRAKELRYVLELLEPVQGRRYKGALQALRAMHECLGECFDALLVAESLRAHPTSEAARAMLLFTLRKAGARIARLPGLLARVDKALAKVEKK
jgi:CHAD domain-containing protein